uniref:Solute carrier family 30 member 9 n=1 Tax=Molossus molossus TaxID=27622 RepID=A0A7J8K1R1_MOLMO|nr:solute carrier family 30 member 9 [Molossus molossus]
MLPGLAAATAAHRCSWSSLCRLRLRCRAAARGSRELQEWQNLVTFGSFSKIVPCSHSYFCAPSQVKLYSTNVQKEAQGSKPLTVDKIPSFDEAVKAVLKKREYGPKYTQNNFITGVRAINEFCLKSSDLEQLRKIRQRSPHEDTESFTVYLRSDVEAKSLEVWGSPEALAREKKLRKEAEIEYRERLFRNQKILREYRDFLGNTKYEVSV